MRAAGELRDRLVIQSPSFAASTQSGQGVASFSTFDTVWAEVRPMSGDERLAAGSIASEVTYQVEIRYRTDVTPAMRVVWTPYGGSAKTFQIHAVDNHGPQSDRIVLHCGVVE